VIIGWLGLANPASAQLSLVSSTPTDGTTNVDTMATFVLTFSAPLDTTARFDEPEDFYLGIELFPADSVGEPEQVTISSDLMEVTVANLPLTADTKFSVLILAAKSTTGDPLDRPYVRTFSTGSSLPTGSVSGTVSFPGSDPEGSVVILSQGSPFGNGGDEALAVVPLGSNTYAANFVPQGNYFVTAFKDVNRDGFIDFPQDAAGGYNADADNTADAIVLGDGASLTNIDVTINQLTGTTARENFATAETIAQSQVAAAALTTISGFEISVEGNSAFWGYTFYTGKEDSLYSVINIGDLFFWTPGLFFDDEENGGDGGDNGDGGPEIIFNIPLPENWIDSDVAADSAMANGGAEFLDSDPDAWVSASLVNFILPAQGMSNNSPISGRNSLIADLDYLQSFGKAAADTDTVAVWFFSFFSDSTHEGLHILLDALTGSPIGFGPGPFFPTAAADNLDAANQAAQNWASDAILLQIGAGGGDVSPEGFAIAWGFAYYSAGKDSIRSFFMVSGMVTGAEPGTPNDVPSLEALPGNFCNSTEASPIAEQNSGNFRNIHPGTLVAAILSRGLLPGDPSQAVWMFRYFSLVDQAESILYVDAMSCDIITDVEDNPDIAGLPSTYDLEQNYPNPFNPETAIRYHLPRAGNIKLAVYNPLGQIVQVLVDESKPAGTFTASWNGTDLDGNQAPNGVYYYRLEAGDFSKTKKMVLLR
jgi:hypothetical protein